MDVVFYTQRVEIKEKYGERWDCADQNIPFFLEKCGYLSIPVPNNWEIAKMMLHQFKPVGIVLTGGNSLNKYGGDAPERDALEIKLLSYALEYDIPVFGFCRGMQVILDFFGCRLEEVYGHVAVHHEIHGIFGERKVNSYHRQACFLVNPPLEILAKAEDGVIEAVRHKQKPVLGIMWHPEREELFSSDDIKCVQKLFGKAEE